MFSAEQLAALDKEALINLLLQLQRSGLLVSRDNESDKESVSTPTAKSSAQTKSEFMSTVTHELRMPMNAILTPARALYSGIITDDETQHLLLKLIVEGGERMLKLIDDILSLSALENGQVKLTLSAEYIHQMLDDILAPYRVITEEKHIRLDAFISVSMPEVIVCDARKVRSIISNLIANAVKFTHEGFVRVGIDAQTEQNSWTITVSDTGIGMPSDAVTYIFERFRQVENDWARQFGGTGIGLALVKEYVELMGGRIDVESTLGKGSVFTITLPLRADKAN